MKSALHRGLLWQRASIGLAVGVALMLVATQHADIGPLRVMVAFLSTVWAPGWLLVSAVGAVRFVGRALVYALVASISINLAIAVPLAILGDLQPTSTAGLLLAVSVVFGGVALVRPAPSVEAPSNGRALVLAMIGVVLLLMAAVVRGSFLPPPANDVVLWATDRDGRLVPGRLETKAIQPVSLEIHARSAAVAEMTCELYWVLDGHDVQVLSFQMAPHMSVTRSSPWTSVASGIHDVTARLYCPPAEVRTIHLKWLVR